MFVPRSVTRSTSTKRPSVPAAVKSEGAVAAKPATTVVDLRAQASTKPNDDVTSTHDDVTEETLEEEEENDDDDDVVISYSKQQRWPDPGEPVCVVCGRYGAYIVDVTEQDVCSLECKAKQLKMAGISLPSQSAETIDKEGDSSEAILTEKQTLQWRAEVGVNIKGPNPPHPVLNIRQIKLCQKLKENLVSANIAQLTPVQMQVIPAVLAGRDVLACSATGSGKTLSFLLPIVQLLSSVTDSAALVLSPTRELCLQLEEQAKILMKGIPGMLTATLIGGVPIPHQLHRLKSNIQVIVGTPARMKELNENHGLDLSKVKILVLDEVDSLLQMGFEEQVKSVMDSLPRHRQNLMFSATIPPKIERLADEILTNPLFVSVGKPSAPSPAIRHTVEWVEESAKKQRLFSFLQDKDLFKPPAVVFVCSKKGCLLLAEAINKVCDVAAVCLHGDMVQERRSFILKGFQEGRYEVIVSTGVLARGLVLPNVQQVFNFDMPSSIDEFVHQIGRAGRLGSPGWAVTFINDTNKGVFCDLVDTLGADTHFPTQLLQSRSLAKQRKRRSRSDEQLETRAKRKKNFYNQDITRIGERKVEKVKEQGLFDKFYSAYH